jgi:cytochrome c5
MTWKSTLLALLAAALLALPAVARRTSKPAPSSTASAAKPAVHSDASNDAMRLDGEKRFQANCGRCHQFPHKFPPRMILTIERHMRVRALVTDEDMRVIIRYLTQ